jgi:uncharacterized protein (DUF58 family)
VPDFEFSGRDLVALQRLIYAARVPTHGHLTGQHRVRRAGQGTDFLDFRRYIPGDDVRRIDWTVFARLRQPFVRVLNHEQTMYVSLLLDVSRSMAAGPEHSKAAMACRLACAMAYVALAQGDHVTVATCSDDLDRMLHDLRGRVGMTRILRFLRDQPMGGGTDLARAARSFCRHVHHRGLAIVLSDFLYLDDDQEPLRVLLAHRFRVAVVQLLNPADWAEGLKGPLRLRDSETGQMVDVIASPERLADYRDLVRARVRALESFCRRRQQFYVLGEPKRDYLTLLAQGLRAQGVFR